MEPREWSILGASFIVLGMFFAKISMQWKSFCDINDEVTMANIFACVRGELFSPFVYLLYALGFIFLLLAWLKAKKAREK